MKTVDENEENYLKGKYKYISYAGYSFYMRE